MKFNNNEPKKVMNYKKGKKGGIKIQIAFSRFGSSLFLLGILALIFAPAGNKLKTVLGLAIFGVSVTLFKQIYYNIKHNS